MPVFFVPEPEIHTPFPCLLERTMQTMTVHEKCYSGNKTSTLEALLEIAGNVWVKCPRGFGCDESEGHCSKCRKCPLNTQVSRLRTQKKPAAAECGKNDVPMCCFAE